MSKMEDIQPSVSLAQILECTICLEVSASPIYNCENGHILCGMCQERIKKCGICNKENLQVSYFAERLAKKYELSAKCYNFASGCTKTVRTAELKAHLKNCEYRAIVCKNTRKIICISKETTVAVADYGSHLVQNHEATTLANGGMWCFTVRQTYSFVNQDFPLVVIKHDNREFVWHVVHRQKIVYWWVTILGSKDDAKRYHFESELIQISLNGKIPTKVRCSWQLPVLNFHDHFEFDKSHEGKFIGVPSETISSQFLYTPDKSAPHKMGFQISMKVVADEKDPAYNLDIKDAVFQFNSLKLSPDEKVRQYLNLNHTKQNQIKISTLKSALVTKK